MTEATATLSLEQAHDLVQQMRQQIGRVMVGQQDVVDQVICALLASGHVLVEGVPGLGKTLLVKALAKCFDGHFGRIQFTPDLMPSDVTGHALYDMKTESFKIRKGPVFTHLLLADEINRAPAKTQAALLEVMQEKQITIEGKGFPALTPFMVLATQNPIEQEGTYPLPEAQVDRFMLKVKIGYPDREEERQIIRLNLAPDNLPKIEPVIDPQSINRARQTVRKIYMDEKIEQYIIDIVFASRDPEAAGLGSLKHLIAYGGSPRASINLALASKAYAFIKRRGYVIPEDVRQICMDVMRHRIGLTYEAEAENITQEQIITEILNTVQVP